MTIKRILVPIPSFASFSGEVDMGLSAAKAMGAHLDALYIGEPLQPQTRAAVAGAYGGQLAVAQAMPSIVEDRENRAREARERFVAMCAAIDIPIVADGDEAATLPAATWREIEGSYETVASRRAAAFDLVVAASAAVVESLKDIAEQSLMQTRRPVLLAPTRRESKFTDTAMVAWDESPECWHAVSAAIPFLQLASSVQVVSVDRHADSRRASQAEAIAYLRCHGIGATARVVAPHLRSVGDTLLAEAGEHRVGILVMGAYSHSRLREMLLGGATRHILQSAAATPVFMAH